MREQAAAAVEERKRLAKEDGALEAKDGKLRRRRVTSSPSSLPNCPHETRRWRARRYSRCG